MWEDVCNIESPSDYKEGVDAVAFISPEWPRKEDERLSIQDKSYQEMLFVLL